MKYFLFVILILGSLTCLCQTTHNVTVTVNQPAKCAIVSTETVENESIEVYPNPAKGVLQIRGVEAGDRLEIYDQLGRNIFSLPSVDDSQLTIDVARFNRGIYTIIIRKRIEMISSRLLLD